MGETNGHGRRVMAVYDTESRWGIVAFGLLFAFTVTYGASNDTCDYTRVGIWRYCGYNNTTYDNCLRQNCCYATDKFTNSMNLTQNCVRPPASASWKNGTCINYNGTVCMRYLGNSTMNKEIFFDTKYGVNGTEKILNEFIGLSKNYVKDSPSCRRLVPIGICQLMLPRCGVDGRPLFPCREDCDYINRICGLELYRFFGALELYQQRENIHFSHLAMPNCPDYKYSYEYAKNDTCVFIGTLPCFNVLKASNGTIRPHVSYGKYRPNHNCTWHVTVPNGYLVKLAFSMMDLEASAKCTNDYVIVRDGLQQASRTLGRICGKVAPRTIESSSNEVSIQFVTDSKEEASGFVIHFEKALPAEKSSSGRNIVLIAAIAGSVVVVFVLVAVLVWRTRASNKRELKEVETIKDLELFTTITTVRDRIRQDSMPNPLVEALSQLSPDQKPPQCRLDRMEYIKDLGQGQFGKVFQGRYRLTENGEEVCVAVKMLKEGSSAETKDSFVKEVTLMSVLQHENILKLLALSIEEEPFCMVFEFMPNGDLNQYLRIHDPENTEEPDKVLLTIDVLVDMAKQIAKGMEYLSKRRFVHRDLATRNCLVGEEYLVKIADFGMSRDVYETDYYKVGGAVMLPIRWMPPEALIYGKFTVESDVYSYGVLLWEMFTYAMQPFYGYSNDEVVKFIRKGVILPKPDLCPQEIYDNVMTRCWFKEPEYRLNFTEIFKRLEGDYGFQMDVPKVAKKKKETRPYSVPPTRNSDPQNHDFKRIPSKKESVGSSPHYMNCQVENQRRASKDKTIPLGMEAEGYTNPLYKTSVASNAVYDVPKGCSSSGEDEVDVITPRRPPIDPRTDNLYDKPKSIPEVDRNCGGRSNKGIESDFSSTIEATRTKDGHQVDDYEI